jgi:voltage-gated sodium channel
MNRLKSFFLNDYCILILILANALLIFIQEFELNGTLLDYIEPVFTLLFVIELIVKISVYGFSKYLSDNWNKVDFVLIIIALPSLGVLFFNNNLFQLNIFLALRVLRVFKFFRLLRFFPKAGSFVASVKRALKASYVVIAGFFVFVFIISLITCALYRKIAPEYFDNPIKSFYSIFIVFSIDGWWEIPNLIASRSSLFIAFISKLYFILILMGGGIIGLSLVNSIFVDAMVSDNNDDLLAEVSNLNKKIDLLTLKIDELNKADEDLKDRQEATVKSEKEKIIQ